MESSTHAAREPNPPSTAFTPSGIDRLREEVARTRDRLRQEAAARRKAEGAGASFLATDGASPHAGGTIIPFDLAAVSQQAAAEQPVAVLIDRVREAFAEPKSLAEPVSALSTDTLEAPVAIAVELACIRSDLERLRAGERNGALAEALAALGRKIDLLQARQADAGALTRLEAQTAELKTTVARVLTERNVSDADGSSPGPRAAEAAVIVQARVDAAAARIEAACRDLPAAALAPVEARLDGISAQLSGLASQRADGLHLPVALDGGAAALAPLVNVIEHHLVALTERVIASEDRLADLDRLEHMEDCLLQLTREMGHLRRAVGDASVETMQAVALRLSVREDAPGMMGLKRGLAVLEARQREFERRTEETLMRGLELELQDLVAMGPLESAGPAVGFDADRRLFKPVSPSGTHERAERGLRAERAAKASPGRRISKQAAARGAVIAAALGLAGLTALQVMAPSDAGFRAGKTTLEAKAPVVADDPASLPAPVGPAALREAALAGDAAAAYEVGMRFADGRGTATDREAAMKWLSVAVAKGSAPAALRLGAIEENGLRNRDGAQRLYDWAAAHGNVRAMHNLGVLASEGDGGTPDWTAATGWFEKAAERGLSDSQHNLGIIYSRGFGGRTDLAEAWKWFALAAAQGDTDSARKRDALAERMDADTLARAKIAAVAFVPKAQDEAANQVVLRPEWEAPEPQRSAAMAGPAVR